MKTPIVNGGKPFVPETTTGDVIAILQNPPPPNDALADLTFKVEWLAKILARTDPTVTVEKVHTLSPKAVHRLYKDLFTEAGDETPIEERSPAA